MLIDKSRIAQLIPHAGAMCLLDGVLEWNDWSIRCVTISHLDTDNPLRTGNRLPVLCGIEYAAQAMAVHGGLGATAGQRPRAGYLASLRNVVCAVDRLDTLDGSLIVNAESLMGDDSRVIYLFELEHDGRTVLSGRAAVVLNVGSL